MLLCWGDSPCKKDGWKSINLLFGLVLFFSGHVTPDNFRDDHLRQDYSQSGDSLVDPISEGRSCQTPRQQAEF